ALDHEVVDDAVEFHAVIKALARQENKIVDRFRGMLREEVQLDLTFGGVDHRFVLLFEINLHFWGRIPLLFHNQTPLCKCRLDYNGYCASLGFWYISAIIVLPSTAEKPS